MSKSLTQILLKHLGLHFKKKFDLVKYIHNYSITECSPVSEILWIKSQK